MSSPTYFDVCVAKNECDTKKDIVDLIADALVGDHVELMQECESLRQQVAEQQEKYDLALNRICNFEDLVAAQTNEIASLRQQLADVKASHAKDALDAERYRWLAVSCDAKVFVRNIGVSDEYMDHAIDAAMKESKDA